MGSFFVVSPFTGNTFRAKTIIPAQGKRPRQLDVLGEAQFIGRGISICSTCNGPLFKEKKVAVVGGGNSTLQTAIEMSRIASSVSLIVCRSIRADPVYTENYTEKPGAIRNITVHL